MEQDTVACLMCVVQDWIVRGQESEKNLQSAVEEHNKAERCCQVIMCALL